MLPGRQFEFLRRVDAEVGDEVLVVAGAEATALPELTVQVEGELAPRQVGDLEDVGVDVVLGAGAGGMLLGLGLLLARRLAPFRRRHGHLTQELM